MIYIGDVALDTSVSVSNFNEFVDFLILCIKYSYLCHLPTSRLSSTEVYRYDQEKIRRNSKINSPMPDIVICNFRELLLSNH